jgi:nicotinamidase/pyrazinamidase
MRDSRTALLIVDVQPTFCEGGSLPVQGGNAVAEKIAQMLSVDHGFTMVITTQDWHVDPGNHFAEEPDYVETWPPHGVAGTREAELHPALEPISAQITSQIKKGFYSAAYSGFEGEDEEGILLADILDSGNIERLVTVGLAFDYCVKATAIDGNKLGYPTVVLKPLTASISEESAIAAEGEMQSAGVVIIEELTR